MSTKGDMLIAAPARWDEACFAVPVLRAFVAADLRVGVLCEQEQIPLWKTLEGVAVGGYTEKTKPAVLAQRVEGNWKASVAWESSIAAEAFHRANIPRRLGMDDVRLRKWLTHKLIRPVPPGPVEHRVQYFLRIADELGVPTAKAEFFAPAMLQVSQDEGAVLLSPDSDYGENHEWPLDRWLELARTLLASGWRVAVAGVPGGRNLGKKLATSLGDDTPIFEAFSPAADLPLLAAYPLLVTADNSIAHLAAHAGTTCVTLFGPNDPAERRPLGRRHAVVRRHVECAPCRLAKCALDLRCQNDLTVERVLQAVREKLPASAPTE